MNENLILAARYVVCMDDGGSVYSPGYVEIEDGLIKSLGEKKDALQGKTRDYGNAALIPGLINSHTHAAMSLLRGFADDLPVDTWLKEHIWPTEARNLSPDFIYDGTMLAAVEMLKTGTTMFADMYFFEDQVVRAASRIGIRGLIGEGALCFPTASVEKPEGVLDVIREQHSRYEDSELIKVHIAAHSTYMSSASQLAGCVELAGELELPVHIHCAESRKEALEEYRKRGKSQIAYLAEIGLLDTRIGLVHMVYPQEGDLRMLERENVTVVSCPQSNLKLGSGIPPLKEYLDKGIRISLGTDGAASNNNLDIWEEMRLAAFLAKGTSLDPISINAQQSLRMMTIDAARTWGVDGELGSLEKGKKADLVVIDLASPTTTPCYDIYSTLAYSACASSVRDVYIAGKRVLKDRIPTSIDESQVLARAEDWARKIRASR